jgi:hypothetical protein
MGNKDAPMVEEQIRGVRGFYHIQITEDDEIVGDSGWMENQVTNLGFNDYLVRLLVGSASSKQITHVALGTGTVPGAAATSLHGELDHVTDSRVAVTAATSSTSKTLRLTATFASANNFVTATANISNIGLFNTSQVTTGTMFAGNTYASSSVGTNQNVNATYDIIFT